MTPVDKARSLLGTPWVHQGRNPAVGIDCAGLLLVAFGAHDDTAYGRDPSHGLFEERLIVHLGEPVAGEPQAGDAVLLGFAERGAGRHVGIIADGADGRLSIIHTDSVIGRVVEHPFDAKWQRRVRLVFRGRE